MSWRTHFGGQGVFLSEPFVINVSHVIVRCVAFFVADISCSATTRPHPVSGVHTDPRTDLSRATLHRHTRAGQSWHQAHCTVTHRAQTQSARPHDHGPVRARHQQVAAQVVGESTADALPSQARCAETAAVARGGYIDGQDLRLQ